MRIQLIIDGGSIHFSDIRALKNAVDALVKLSFPEQIGELGQWVTPEQPLDFRDAGICCDMLVGPCACGAWHN